MASARDPGVGELGLGELWLGEPERRLVRGGTLAFWHLGHGGVPLLMVHGWPATRRIWARNVAALAARGFEVIAPDLRGFGDSDCGADGLHDVVAHSLDLAALLRDHLGLDRVVAAGGDLGAAVVQDLSLRVPGLVDRLVVFNGPLPSLRDRTAHLPSDERRFEDSHGFRPATEPDALIAELSSPRARMDYVAGHYRAWSPPGAFSERDLTYLTEPFADAAKLRASFGTYESLIDPAKRTGRSMIAANDTPALILVALADPCCYPAFGQRAALTFARHTGPFGILDAGHFPQWEAAAIMNDAIAMYCADRLAFERPLVAEDLVLDDAHHTVRIAAMPLDLIQHRARGKRAAALERERGRGVLDHHDAGVFLRAGAHVRDQVPAAVG
jgi:pimeloyl-ACP methyl ester carboxylesterase